MYFDTHAHLTLCDEADISIAEHLYHAKEAHLIGVLDAGLEPHDFSARYQTLKDKDNVFLGIGYAPSKTDVFPSEAMQICKECIREGKVHAISEIGLEYYHYKHNHAMQKEIFAYQLHLAKDSHLPVFCHVREAFKDFYEMVKSHKVQRGVVHCFTGTMEDAMKLIDLGWILSFSGMITFPRMAYLREIVKTIPIEQIVTETDTPYLSPKPMRGRPNRLWYLRYTNEAIASLKQLRLEECNRLLLDNVKRLLPLQASL